MRVPRVGSDRIELPVECGVTVDVLFDGQRVWSLHPVREGRLEGDRRRVEWPPVLRPFLNGVVGVTIREHVGSHVWYDEEVRFGTSDRRIQVVEPTGHPLAVSKAGDLKRMFEERRSEVIEDLVAGLERLLHMLRSQGGVDPFLAFGGLLGAVRDGHIIGHDTDGDVGYLSRHTHPLDVTLESFELERVARRHGFRTKRVSGGTFKVFVSTVDERAVGVDVFAGFYVSRVFHLMPGVRGDLPVESLLPLSTVVLEGVTLPAPADPAALLELTYGPGWKVPDPAFHYEHPPSATRRFNGWMRGESMHLGSWESFTPQAVTDDRLRPPSPFARWVVGRGHLAPRVVDLGCGTGRDSLLFARQGAHVQAIDYAKSALQLGRRRARRAQMPVTFELMSLYRTGAVLVTAARLAHENPDEPIDIYSRLVLSAVTDLGRLNFWRMAKMLLPLGGRIYLEFRTPHDQATAHEFQRWRRYLEPAEVIEEARDVGAVVEDCREGRGLATFGVEDPYVCQLVLKGR